VTAVLGIDLGERRMGLSVAEGPDGRARPLPAIGRGKDVATDAAALLGLVARYRATEVVVGLPLHASGEEGAQARLTRSWVEAIAPLLGVPITMRDERLSSHVAEERLGPPKRGRSGGPPTSAQRRARRARVDSMAAAIILQDELDARGERDR